MNDTLAPKAPGSKRDVFLCLGWATAFALFLGATVVEILPAPLGVALVFVSWLVLLRALLKGRVGPVVGPHFFYDIVRMARRGRSTVVRVLFILALLVGLGFVFGGRLWRGDLGGLLFNPAQFATNDLARLAEIFVNTIVVLQNLAVFLLTPAYVASAIAEEREQRSLELLFTTHLSNREIVIGKLGARAVHLGGVMLASLPVLSLSQLLGGVDMVVLLANFANTFLNLLSVGAVAILVSTLSRSVFAAVMTTYGIVVPLGMCFSCVTANGVSSPFVMMAGGDGYQSLAVALGVAAMFHAVVTGACLAVAISELRNPLPSQQLARPPVQEVYGAARATVEEKIAKVQKPRRQLPPIDADPLLWKEMYLGGGLILFSPAFWVPLGSVLTPLLVMFGLMILSAPRADGLRDSLQGFAMLFRFLLLLLPTLFCLGIGYRACASFAKEKQQRTLDSLLVLPVTPRHILRSKWLGALYKGWPWAALFVPLLILSMLAKMVNWQGGLLMLAAPFVHAVFLCSLGLYLSIMSRTTLAAQLKMAFILLGLIVTTALFSIAFRGDVMIVEFWTYGLNPLGSWFLLTTSPWDLDELNRRMSESAAFFNSRMAMVLAGLLIYAAGAVLFWLQSQRSFGNERHRASA